MRAPVFIMLIIVHLGAGCGGAGERVGGEPDVGADGSSGADASYDASSDSSGLSPDAGLGYCVGASADPHCHPGLTPDLYAAGLTKTTNHKNFAISLWSTPVPGLGEHQMEVEVRRLSDGAGAPGMRMRTIVDLHDVGSPDKAPIVRELGGGRYALDGVLFPEPGLWELVILVQEGKQLDVVSYFFLAL